MEKKLTVFLFYLFICLSSTFVLAAQDSRNQTTDITSDRMTYTGQEYLVIFAGNVHVVRPDFELWSHELHVFLKPAHENDSPGQQENIEKIMARGDVRIRSDNREGHSDLLTYLPDTGIARLEGSPRLVEGQNSVEGETIILNMSDNTSEVLGGPEKRVRVIFHSESEPRE